MGYLEEILFKLEVSEAEQNKHFWATVESFDPETKARLLKADVVVIPNDYEGQPVFPEGTSNFVQILKGNNPAYAFEVASNVDSYIELALHSNERRWPTLLVIAGTVALDIVTGVLAGQILEVMKEPSPPTSIEMSLVVDNQDGRCVRIFYKGPPKDLVETFETQIARCFPQAVETELEHNEEITGAEPKNTEHGD